MLGPAIFGVGIVVDNAWLNVGDMILESVVKLLYAFKIYYFRELKVTLALPVNVKKRVISNTLQSSVGSEDYGNIRNVSYIDDFSKLKEIIVSLPFYLTVLIYLSHSDGFV